jgi:phosphotransferase system HPr (HPr) family protein
MASLKGTARNSHFAADPGCPMLPVVPMSRTALISRPVKLNLAQGLHIRACSRVVALVGRFDGKVRIQYGDRSADASSMFDLVQLAAVPGADLILEGQGDGAAQILDALEQFFSQTTESAE